MSMFVGRTMCDAISFVNVISSHSLIEVLFDISN